MTKWKNFPRPPHITDMMFLRPTACSGLFKRTGLDAVEGPLSTGCAIQEAARLLHSVAGGEAVKMAELLLILGIGQQLSTLWEALGVG